MDLIELSLLGMKYTWRRGKSSSRLDRAFMEPIWLQKINSLQMKGVPCSLSDHIPLLIQSIGVDWGPKPFRSIDAWFSHP